MKKVYIMENLGCANCASKIEKKIAALPGVNEAVLTFATKQLRLDADDPDLLLPQMQKIANSLEPDIIITERTRRRKTTAASPAHESHVHSPAEQEHHHNESCGCGQNHSHERHQHHHDETGSCEQDHPHEEHSHHHNETCGCGHDHSHEEHNHHHDETCSCEQDHSHEEHSHHHNETCGCGHDHSHEEHNHHHNETCGCGRDHSLEEHNHHHNETCGCGHDHSLEEHNHHHNETCSCGHDHSLEEHNHHHSETCSYGQDQSHEEHNHYHSETCSCGHDHSQEARQHHHDETCSCEQTPSQEEPDQQHDEHIHTSSQQPLSGGSQTVKPAHILSGHGKELAPIAAGAVLFIAGEIVEHMDLPAAAFILALAAYILLGGKVILTALKNLGHGQIFDENFLMSIATIGAFFTQQSLEAVGVMLFYRIGEFFEHVAVERSRSQIMDAVDLRPEVVNLVSGSEIKVIDAEDAVAGDILLVRPGDRIPLDGVVVEGESRIDTSPVTGEPVPVRAAMGDSVTSGCVNTSGQIKIRVEKILEESMVTRILDSVENAAASKPKLDRFITRFARIYTPFVILLALGTAIIPSLVSGNWNYWIYTALTFLVMSCPCALVLSVPLAFFSGIGAGSKKGILFKGGVSLEAIQNIKTVIMDKTGTITQGNFKVQKAVPTAAETSDEVLALCASCEMSSTHPIAQSIVSAAHEKALEIRRPSQVEEIAGHGIRAVIAGHEILCGSRKLMDKFNIDISSYAPTAYGTEVLAAKDGVYMGYLVISDTIKKDAQTAVSELKSQGITPVMLTGDAHESAKAVAEETGITEVHARLLPQDKVSELSKIRDSHGAVMFVGDGINDAPVLAGADVGAAMGSGADAAIEAADVVFMTSSMEAIPQAISIARRTNSIAMQNVVFALIIKAIVMVLGLCGFASMWMAVFADSGVAMLCVLNSIRILYSKKL